MGIKDKIYNFGTWQNILLIINTIVLVVLSVLCFHLLKQQKYFKIRITDLTNRPIYEQEYDPDVLSIAELQVLNFDRDAMITAYKNSLDECDDFPMEGTGSLYICQDKYFKETQKDLNESYRKIDDFCRENIVQTSRVKCMNAILQALKNNQIDVTFDDADIIQ